MRKRNIIKNLTSKPFGVIKLSALFMALMAIQLLPGLVSSAHATKPELLSTHKDWSAYTFEENGNKICYMASTPRKAEGDYSKRGEIYALITHRPAENTENVFSYIAGYDYKANSDVELKIGNKEFTLFTQDDTAWAPDSETDKELSESIRAGIRMIVSGTSSRGTKTKDTFSLSGSNAAYKAISKACGI